MGSKGLVTTYGEGGLQNGRGAYEILPRRKGGAENVLAMLEWGTNSFGVVSTWQLEVLAILKGGTKSFHSLKGGHEKFYPVLGRGGGAKSFSPAIFPFCSPPPCY